MPFEVRLFVDDIVEAAIATMSSRAMSAFRRLRLMPVAFDSAT